MTHTEAFNLISKKSGLRRVDMAEQLGKNSISTISMRINRKRLLMKNALELLELLDYEMALVPKESSYLPDGAYVIRKEDYQ